jgi:hypothetical protein
MAVVTVIGERGVQVLVEFAGGPRSGSRTFAIATTDLEGKPIPPSGFGSGQLPDDPLDAAEGGELGTYVVQGLTPDGEAYAYVWRASPAATAEPLPNPSPPDLATRIRRAYARRATPDTELDEALQPRVIPRPKTSDGGG